MSPFDGDSNTIGIQYCPGYVDKNGVWKVGFYCPPKSQGRKMYCCGSTIHKYCCGAKEESELFGGSSISYISSSTMFTVTIVTFIFAVILTVLGFVCCRKFFKRHLNGLDPGTDHSYRMSTSCPVGAPVLINGTTGTTGLTTPYTGLTSLNPGTHHLFNPNRLIDSYLPTISSYINQPTIGFLEPPPPYQVTPSYYNDPEDNNNTDLTRTNNSQVSRPNQPQQQQQHQQLQPLITTNNNNNNHNLNTYVNNVDRTNNNQNRILTMLSAPYRRDIIHPCEGQKRLWRTMSQ